MSHSYAPQWVVFEPKRRKHRHHRHDGEMSEMRGGGHRGWGPGPGGPGFGPGPGPGGPGFGPGGPGRHGGPGHRGRGGRARRGDVRAAALLLLEEQPRNGYGLMQELETRSDGVWRPSPGSMYPALAQLEDEGLIRSTEVDGKKLFELTDEGKAHVEEKREQFGTPWTAVSEGIPDGVGGLFAGTQQLWMAVEQVARGGSKEQIESAKTVLDDAKKAIYKLLAGD